MYVIISLGNFLGILEKVTSHNKTAGIFLDGNAMSSSMNLKEINMNNTVFYYYGDEEKDCMLDLNNHQEIFIFHRCCKILECNPIKNVKFTYYRFGAPVSIPQNELIKFVRNSPRSWRWFRSDLIPHNMIMLRLERPGIELLN